MNQKRDTVLILITNPKISKQTRSEASKNKVITKRVSNIINQLSKTKWIIK